MVVLISSIYSEKLGCDKYRMELTKPVKLIEVLEHLESALPALADRKKGRVADRYAAHYLCIGGGRILRLGDTITNRDTIEIIPPIMGG
ncbi:MAG: MoaD/ThiS family protein [Firmicutes bacterium]|nr:MoaD/ThiS family protein [Bacillota bacterium]MDD3298656.1 MoaD/ThiS family protein [Bacillota bacterium]MDD3851584.1 MoaD/ThiS family protein [Bacillota bacterium]